MILRLPFFAQLAVIQQMKLFECFFLGSLSRKSRSLVQRTMKNEIETIVISLNRNIMKVKKRSEEYSEGIFHWRIIDCEGPVKMKKCNKNVWIDLEYNGIQMKFRVTSVNDLLMPQIWCDIENRQFLPIALHSTICDVFNTPKIIKVRMGISKKLIAQFPSITEIDHLSEGTYLRRIRADGSALEKLLRRVKINHSLTINTFVKFDSNSPILSVDHLKIASGFHMTREYLFNFSGKSGMFWCTHKLKNDDVIDFVKRWLEGSNTKLESLYLANQTNGPSFDKEKILEQFDTNPWDPKRRDGRFIYSKNAVRWQSDIDILDCTQQLDIEREHDGLLATMIVTNKIFCFFVWHTPFAKPGNNLPVMAKSEPNQLPRYYLGSVVY